MDNRLNHTETMLLGHHQSSPHFAKRDSVELGFSMTFSYAPAKPTPLQCQYTIINTYGKPLGFPFSLGLPPFQAV